MVDTKANCDRHGEQELAIACIHVCRSLDSRDDVGFYWDPDSNGARHDAWCHACEQWSLANPDESPEVWMKVTEFKFLCVRCWDEAKARYTQPKS